MPQHPHQAKELFPQGVSLEQFSRNEVRPLGQLSDFVVNQVPSLLNEIREEKKTVAELIQRSEDLALIAHKNIGKLAKKEKYQELLIARIDVLLLNAAIRHEGGTPGPLLTKLINLIVRVTARPATLTYEDVVINNPIKDIRTFTNGEVGVSEAGFYNGHRYIEFALDPAIQTLRDTLNDVVRLSTEEIIERVRTIVDAMNTLIAYTGTISKKLPEQHFKGTFRKYLGSFKDLGLNGPSGAFTPSVPLIEHMLMGETLTDEDAKYLQENIQYFPLEQQQELISTLRSARRQKMSVRSILISRGAPEEGMKLLKELSTMFTRFRTVHYGAVQKHLPEVNTGTGGTHIDDFLIPRRDRTHGL